MAKQCSCGGGRPLLATEHSPPHCTGRHAGSSVAQGQPWKQVDGLGSLGRIGEISLGPVTTWGGDFQEATSSPDRVVRIIY